MDAAPHSHGHPAAVVGHRGLGARPRPRPCQPLPVPSARANPALAATCSEHMHTHTTLFQAPKFTNSWRFCAAARAVPDVTEN